MKKTIRYNLGLGSVARDSEGNLITDSAGNVIIPIESFTFSFYSTNFGCIPDWSDIGCLFIELELPDRTIYRQLCGGSVIEDNYGIWDDTRSHIFRPNLRYLSKQYGERFEMGFYVYPAYKPNLFEEKDESGKKVRCEYIYFNYSSISVWSHYWEGYSITSNSGGCGNAWGHRATFTVDLNALTVTGEDNDLQSLPWGEQCDAICQEVPPPDIEITVICNTVFCSGGGYVYTSENYDYIFASQKNTTELKSGETEEDAIKRMASDTITAKQELPYFVAESGLRYWRDKEHDIPSGAMVEVSVFSASVLGRNEQYGDVVYIEQPNRFTPVDGNRIFSNASQSNDISDDQKKEFLASKLKVAETKWHSTPDWNNNPIWYLISAVDPDGNSLIEHENYGYMIPTGESVTLDDTMIEETTFAEFKTYDGRFTAWMTPNYIQGGGTVAAFPSKPYIGKDEWGLETILPSVHASNRAHLRSVAPASGKYTEVNGVLYQQPHRYDAEQRYIWDANVLFAWSLSPCYTDIPQTLYTDKEVTINDDGSVSGEIGVYGTFADGVFSAIGNAVSTDIATYSITGTRGNTYFWKEDLAIEDEEFE